MASSDPIECNTDTFNTLTDCLHAVYLSKTSNDTVAGAITFEEKTTHENGVDVTGGTLVCSGRGTFVANISVTGGADKKNPAFSANTTFDVIGPTNSKDIYPNSFKSTPINNTDNLEFFAHYHAQSMIQNAGKNIGQQIAFHANRELTDKADTTLAFYSDLNEGNNNNFNFYSAGTAPNYLNGTLIVGPGLGTPIQVGQNTENVGSLLRAGASAQMMVASAQPVFQLKKTNAGTTDATFINYFVTDGTNTTASIQPIGTIALNDSKDGLVYWAGGTASTGAAYTVTSDYRLKSNIVDAPSAVNLVKQLQPREYTIGTKNNARGFIAHELQQVIPEAVTGTKDAEEAIGTVVDYDGTELETAVVQPDDLTYTEEVETNGVTTMVTRTRTWTPTGNRPVYQGVDQTKLIPLLTKALQEALDKIEALETRLFDAGIA